MTRIASLLAATALLASAGAMAAEPVKLSSPQLDGVTAGFFDVGELTRFRSSGGGTFGATGGGGGNVAFGESGGESNVTPLYSYSSAGGKGVGKSACCTGGSAYSSGNGSANLSTDWQFTPSY